jgi:hypothetical protein
MDAQSTRADTKEENTFLPPLSLTMLFGSICSARHRIATGLFYLCSAEFR